MAIAVTLDPGVPLVSYGNLVGAAGTLALDTSYPTGGYPLTKATIAGAKIASRMVLMQVATTSGYVFEYDYTNEKLKVLTSAAVSTHTHTGPSHTHTIAVTAGTAGDAVTNNAGVLESTGGQDLTTAAGGTGATGASGAVSAAALAEAANGTNLSALTAVRFLAFGY